MVRASVTLLAWGACGVATAVHQAARRSGERWSLFGGGKQEEQAVEEEGEVRDTSYHGLPAYYEGHMPANFFEMTHMEKQDFYFRVERWHTLLEESKERCRSPRPGEKVVYFVHHADPTPKQEDAEIWPLGYAQSKNMRFDPLLAAALSNNTQRRAQVLIVSPARKAMQTAVIGFSESLPEIAWELNTDVRGFGWVEGTLVPTSGLDALTTLGMNQTYQEAAATLWSQYKDLPPGFEKATKPHKDRWYDFGEELLHRPEERFIIVSHGGMIRMANISKTHSSEVQLRALLPDRTWRKLSPPECWPDTV